MTVRNQGCCFFGKWWLNGGEKPTKWIKKGGLNGIYHLVMTNIAMENGPCIDVLPIKMVIFHSYVNVYQRLNHPSMGDLQDPTGGGSVQYVWPYFEGIFLEIEPLHMPYIW